MNTSENDITLDPVPSNDTIYSDDIHSENSTNIHEYDNYSSESSENNTNIPEYDNYSSESIDFDIQTPQQETIEPSIQVAPDSHKMTDSEIKVEPKQQEQIQENSIEKTDSMKDQQSQANTNTERQSFTDNRFNMADGLGGSNVGNRGRLSSETTKPSPMASSRAMETKLKIANRSGPAWRENYI